MKYWSILKNKVLTFLWEHEIYDNRLPDNCKFLNCCMTCPAFCNWKKVKQKEILNEHKMKETL